MPDVCPGGKSNVIGQSKGEPHRPREGGRRNRRNGRRPSKEYQHLALFVGEL